MIRRRTQRQQLPLQQQGLEPTTTTTTQSKNNDSQQILLLLQRQRQTHSQQERYNAEEERKSTRCSTVKNRSNQRRIRANGAATTRTRTTTTRVLATIFMACALMSSIGNSHIFSNRRATTVVGVVEASISSVELRAAALQRAQAAATPPHVVVTEAELLGVSRNLLFWSSYDCSVDAALQWMGPLVADAVVTMARGGAAATAPPPLTASASVISSSSSDTTTVTTTESAETTTDTTGSMTDTLLVSDTVSDPESSTIHNKNGTLVKDDDESNENADDDDDNEQQDENENTDPNILAATATTKNANGSVGSSSSILHKRKQQDNNNNNKKDPLPVPAVDPKYCQQSKQYIFSLYQEGDGSATDPDGIPTRYLKMQLNRREAAKAALQSTLAWRLQHNIDCLLQQPQTKFDICKRVFPHYFVGRDVQDHVVFVQRPALLDLELAHVNALANHDLLLHYVYVNEYLWQIAEGHSPLGTMTSILDLTGLHLGVLRQKEILGFLKTFVSTMDAHYPQRAHKTMVLNAPKWFHMLYKLISPLLRESTKAKIEIYSSGKQQDEALLAQLTPETAAALPSVFWSKERRKLLLLNKNNNSSQQQVDDVDPAATAAAGEEVDEEDEVEINTTTKKDEYDRYERNVIPDSEMERELREFTLARIREAGKEMEPVKEK